MNTIDLTKKYKTRDGREVTGLRYTADPDSEYTLMGTVHEKGGYSWSETWSETWTGDGIFSTSEPGGRYDLVLADEDQDPSLLIFPTEYVVFVAAVKANFVAGTFATATQEQFDAWLGSLTPSLRA